MIKNIEEAIVLKKFVSETEKLIVNILYTSNFISRIHTSFFKQFNLTSEQYNVLRILRGQFPKTCSVTLISERMIEKSSNSSRILDKLISKKLAVRSVSIVDKRLVDVLITTEGLELLNQIDPLLAKLQTQFNGLNTEEISEVSHLLDKFRSIQTIKT